MQLVERYPALKVIYMSRYTEDAIVEHGVLHRGVALLPQPFNSGTLTRQFREALDPRSAAPAAGCRWSSPSR
jgi:hypothetical protein